jgi:hypothetical protein
MGLRTPMQHSASAAQDEPSALQATSCGSGVEATARPCSVKKAVTVRCEAAFCSSSHAAAGKVAIDRVEPCSRQPATKSAVS